MNDIDKNKIDSNNYNSSLLKKHRKSKKANLQSIFKVLSKLEFYYNRALQDDENTTSSNRLSEIDKNQDRYRT